MEQEQEQKQKRVNGFGTVHDFTKCPRCHSKTKRSVSYAGTLSEYFVECTHCNTYIDTFVPMEHQYGVLSDNHRYTGNFGGYGTGKTTTTRKEMQKHAMITPNGLIIVGAKRTSQYENTLKKEFEHDIPRAWVKDYSQLRQTMVLVNGCRIIYRPMEDPDSLRSYNASMFVILEASEVKYDAFSQLQTRLRNLAAGVQELDEYGNQVFVPGLNSHNKPVNRPKYTADWRRGIIESNPDSGWIRTHYVLRSSAVELYGDVVDGHMIRNDDAKHPEMASHIASTNCNIMLPADYEQTTAFGKPDWWVSKFLYGSFAYSEGTVYPSAAKRIVEPFQIPADWKRLVAHDYGLRDPSVFVAAALDVQHNNVYIYKEARAKETNIDLLAQLYHEFVYDIPIGGMYRTPLIDPKSGPRRDYNKDSLIKLYLQRGILFDPAAVNIDARIYRLNTYLEQGNIFIFNTCTELIEEFELYKFPDRILGKSSSDKPIDANNHGVNCVEWIVMELPADPAQIQNLGGFDQHGYRLDAKGQKHYTRGYDPLADKPEDPSNLCFEMVDYTTMF